MENQTQLLNSNALYHNLEKGCDFSESQFKAKDPPIPWKAIFIAFFNVHLRHSSDNNRRIDVFRFNFRTL